MFLQLFKKFPLFCKQKFHYRAHNSPSVDHSARPVQSISSLHSISWKSVLIISSYLCPVLPTGFFHSVLPKQSCTPLSPPVPPKRSHTSHPSHSIPSNIQSAALLMKLPTMQSLAVNCFPIPLNHKYLPPHSILRRPQYMFLTQYKATRFTPKYKQANYISVYINFYIFFIIKWKKIYWKNGDELKDKNCTAIYMQ